MTTVEYELVDYFGNMPTTLVEYGYTRNYDYSCNEIKTVEILKFNINDICHKTETFYEGKDPCFEIKDADLNISIFPNPTSGSITIQSPILQSGNTQISVLSIDGKVLLEKTEIKRCEEVDLDLGNFINGFYLVKISNQNYNLVERVVLAR